MGNSNSSSETEEEVWADNNEDEDVFSDNEMTPGAKEDVVTPDLNNLFDPQMLRTLAAKIREDVPVNVLHQHHSSILRWIYDRPESQERISMPQFTDMLMSKGVGRAEAIKVFQHFDTEGSGMADVSTILDLLDSFSGGSYQGDIGDNIQMLQACALTPGFVDVYAGDKNPIINHGERILKYLLRNRVESMSIPFPLLNGFNNTCNMRLPVLKSTFNHLKNTASETEEQELGEGEELRPITKCYTSIEVSTNSADAYRLTNGDPNTFWQSDGTAKSHWIRLRMKNNAVLKHLSVSVASTDQSYMPELISVLAGRNPRALREIKEIRVPSNTVGEVVLLKNAKVYYPVIQVHIKRCHSDGCDTRIHALKAIAYRVVKEPGVSILDASATWYLQILSSLVGATIPQSPHLRNLVIKHTRTALEHMPPLSLCGANYDKPQFLSRHVLKELDKFIMEMSIFENKVQPEGLYLVLALNLARGNVTRLIQILRYFYDSPEMSLECSKLLHSALEAKNSCWERLGSMVPMSALGCSGGKENLTSLENIINHSSEGSKHTFYGSNAESNVDLFFKSKDFIQFTKFRIKIPAGGKGPRRGLIFVLNNIVDFNFDEEVKKFHKYDTWHELEYKFSVNIRSAGVGGKPDNPVSYFQFDDDCDEMDIPVSWYPTGKVVVVKLLEARQETVNEIGVMSIKFFGFKRKLPHMEEDKMILPLLNPEKKTDCSSLEIVQWILSFIVDLSLDLVKKKGRISKGDYLDYTGVELETIWNLYQQFKHSSDPRWKGCSLMILKLLHSLTSVVIPLTETAKKTSDEMFQYLCKIIDNKELDKHSEIYLLSEQLIVDGASLFFPNKEMKRQRLFAMMNNVENLTTAPSVALVFQSLCQFFSSVDPQGLLDLPKQPTESFDIISVLDVMKTMIVVASQEFTYTSTDDAANEQLTYLIQLTASLQSSLMAWCSGLLVDEDDAIKNIAIKLITEYSIHVANRAAEVMHVLISRFDKDNMTIIGYRKFWDKMSKSLQPPFLSSIVRQLILILSNLSPKLDLASQVIILHKFKPLLENMEVVRKKAPNIFPTISENYVDSTCKSGDIVLRTWELESPHNYENNSHVSQVFFCPGCTSFKVVFDPRCETERRYDYLEFTDGKGMTKKLDQKVGSAKWQKEIEFSGPTLHFLFRSDGSNNEWGYKFNVTAIGTPDAPLSWPYDLELGLCKLFGGLCGLVLSSNPVVPKNSYLYEVEDSVEQDILRSELWTSLFRGGYMVGKLQRSLSHKMMTDESSQLLIFLNDLVASTTNLTKQFLSKCKQSKPNSPDIGRDDVKETMLYIFSALIWHTQQLREDMERYLKSNGEMVLTDGILQAYHIADGTKLLLIKLRQNIQCEEEKISDDTDPVLGYKKKAIFLLKFAGLNKVQLKMEKLGKNAAKKMGNKRKEMTIIKSEVCEKYPSFKLVMEFIVDLAWTTERVQLMLKERSSYASSVSDVYTFTGEIIKCLTDSNPFQITLVMFFQEMFVHQDNFPLHYATGLEGCGLQQESRVRLTYYALARQLTETFTRTYLHKVESYVVPAYHNIQICLLHLLDVQWKPYDLNFVSEIKLPELFMKIAKETVKMRNCTIGEDKEDQELADYDQCMKWLTECADGFGNWYNKDKDDINNKERKKEVQMFVARFCDLLDVEVNCDGCRNTLPGRRYRCLQCIDLDLCTTCYSGGVRPDGDHQDDHDTVHLVFKCNQCQGFIVGTRIHCKQCEDFDLCLGCHTNKKFPAEHLVDHEFTKIPPVRLKTVQSPDSQTQAYIHQHVWMLFTSLALSLGEIINSNSTNSDSDYIRLAAQLQNQCITLCTDCLQKVPEDDGSKHIMEQNSQSLETRQEEAFAIHSQERIMGLLGAMIQMEIKVPIQGVQYNFTTKEFLQLLFTVARGDCNHELTTQHLAMGLLGRLLAKTPTEVADAACLTISTYKSGQASSPGQETVNYLFNFGASCLEKSGLEWACSMACILASLTNAPQWKSIVCNHVSSCVQTLKQHGFVMKSTEKSSEGSQIETSSSVDILPSKDNVDSGSKAVSKSSRHSKKSKPELSSIFAMFVIAGFPEVLTIGTHVNYIHKTVSKKNGIAIKHFPDKYQTLIVDLTTRRRYTVKDQYVTCTGESVELWDTDHVTEFTSIVTDTIGKIKSGETLLVETLWVLSLALKVLNNYLQTSTLHLEEELFSPNFIQGLVYMASRGTGFSQQWLLKDLEVLSLMLYTDDHSTKQSSTTTIIKTSPIKSSKKEAEKSKCESGSEKGDDDDDDEDDDDSDDDDDDESETPSMPSSLASDVMVFLDSVDAKTKSLFEALHTKYDIPKTLLQVIYEMNEGKWDSVIKDIIENFENSGEIKKFLENWEKKDEEKDGEDNKTNCDKILDTGIDIYPSKINDKKSEVVEFKRESLEKATEEKGETTVSLIPNGTLNQGKIGESRQNKSSELLRKELLKYGRSGSCDYLTKVNMAMCIIYSRCLLRGLLAQWPPMGPTITSNLLGCTNIEQIPCILDLLCKMDGFDNFLKVVEKVISNCDVTSLIPISCKACQFMEEMPISSVTKESEHSYASHTRRGKIHLPGASLLTVTFDSRCSLMEDIDELIFFVSDDPDKQKHVFTGSGKSRWTSFQVPGDTIRFKFNCDSAEPKTDFWGYKFVVTAGTRGSFETGYTILDFVLSQPVALELPLTELWSRLVYVACIQTDIQRLQAIQLLLKIIECQPTDVPVVEKRINFSILNPLWKLYVDLTKTEEDPSAILPPIVRALTDLFLQVENIVQSWDLTKEYLVAMMDLDDIKKSVFRGLMNIAAIGQAIHYDNMATDLVKIVSKIM